MADKLYIVENSGEYCSHCDKEYTSWTYLILCAKIFKTYQKAYNFMRKVNKLYGFNRCSVVKYTPNEVNAYTWEQMNKNAE